MSIPNHQEVLLKVGNYMIDHQNSNGGWAYHYAKQGGHVDTSIVAWQMQALKALEYTCLPFHKISRSAQRGVQYLEGMQNAQHGFGYSSPGTPAGMNSGNRRYRYFTMTGGSVLTLQLWGQANSAAFRNGARKIRNSCMTTSTPTFTGIITKFRSCSIVEVNNGGNTMR